MKKDYLKKLCICALMAALFVPLELLASNFGKIAFLDNYQIPISCFPLILISVMFGVRWGAVTAIVGSFVSQLSMGYGINWSTFLWMIPTIVYAILVALLYKAFRKSNKRYFLAIQFFISSIVLSLLNIGVLYVDSLIYGYPYNFLNGIFKFIISLKIIGGISFAWIFALVTPTIINSIRKIIKL